jgi:hypothetical protein
MGYNAIDYGNAIQDLQPERHRVGLGPEGPERRSAVRLPRRERRHHHHDEERPSPAGPGHRVTATSTLTFERPLKLPEYQNLYGQGWNGRYSYVDGRGNGVYDDYDESWGPRLDMGLMIPQFFSNGQPAPVGFPPGQRQEFLRDGP